MVRSATPSRLFFSKQRQNKPPLKITVERVDLANDDDTEGVRKKYKTEILNNSLFS